MTKTKRAVLGWTICSLAAIFYCYQYLLRISPSIMVQELMQVFHANATELGILVGFYYFAYTPMQVVVGVLLDLYGPRKILTVAVFSCTLGSYIFGTTEVLFVAAIGRLLIGLGSAFAFVCVLKLAHAWLPQRFFALFAGMATSLGMLGAIFQVTVLGNMVGRLGWQQIIGIGTFSGALLFPLIWLVVRDRPEDLALKTHSRNKKPQYRKTYVGFLKIIRHPQVWLSGIIACLMDLSITMFAELWGIPFLTATHNLTHQNAANACAMVYLGWFIGGPLVGYVSDVTGSRKWPIVIGSLLSAILITLIIYVSQIKLGVLHWLLFLFGVASSAEVLCFAISSENSPKSLVATSAAFTNFLTMLGAMITQPLIGRVLDLLWSGKMVQNVRIYSGASYQHAFVILPIAFFIVFILTFWLRETGSRRVVS